MEKKIINGEKYINEKDIVKAVIGIGRIYPSVVDTVFTDILKELYIKT